MGPKRLHFYQVPVNVAGLYGPHFEEQGPLKLSMDHDYGLNSETCDIKK